jgi:hypothetical protein
MAMILAGAIAITATVAWYRIAMLDSINPGELMNDATTALRNQGILGLKTWLETVTSAHPDLDIYVVDASGKDLLLRPLPERIEQWLVLDGGPQRGKDGSFSASYFYCVTNPSAATVLALLFDSTGIALGAWRGR